MLLYQKTLEDQNIHKIYKINLRIHLTYGADNNTTMRGLEERHGMSRYGGEVGKGEEEDKPHQIRVS